jgi:polyhydroxyalkanoate synthesis regulator phasin
VIGSPREAVEQAILVSVGAASLTRERAESIVSQLVSRGTLSREEGTAMLGRLMARVRGEGPPTPSGLLGRVEGGAQAAFRELGLATRSEVLELRIRLAELERRLVLIEAAHAPSPDPSEPPAEPGAPQ